jgi:hypothetical protein
MGTKHLVDVSRRWRTSERRVASPRGRYPRRGAPAADRHHAETFPDSALCPHGALNDLKQSTKTPNPKRHALYRSSQLSLLRGASVLKAAAPSTRRALLDQPVYADGRGVRSRSAQAEKHAALVGTSSVGFEPAGIPSGVRALPSSMDPTRALDCPVANSAA